MPATRPRELTDDEPLSAEWLNQFVAYVEANQVTIAPDSGLIGSIGPRGLTIAVQDTPPIWIKLTYGGSNGAYSWTEQVPAPGGTWTDGFRKGFVSGDPYATGGSGSTAPPDPAWEANLVSNLLTGYRVLAYRDPAVGRLTFRAGHC